MEFYSQNDGFAGAEKGIGEFHPSFSSPFLKPISGAMAQLFKTGWNFNTMLFDRVWKSVKQ